MPQDPNIPTPLSPIAGVIHPRVTGREILHQGKKFNFEVLSVEHAGKADGQSRILKREHVRHPGAVVVVAVLDRPANEGGRSLVLIRNYRISVEQRLLECCAGTIERPREPDGRFAQGEDPETCAARELIEETGYQAGLLKPLGWFYTTPGLTDEQMFVFVATDLKLVGQKLEEDESIQVELLPVHSALQMIREGQMRDAKSMLAILLAQGAGML